jgi:Predicted pPIWI-associating nuclease
MSESAPRITSGTESVQRSESDFVEQLQSLLPDDFSRRLLAGSCKALVDADNPLRLTFFSIGLREMIGHILHSLAPDGNVEQCTWFESEEKTITRRQRAKYMVQGGLLDTFLQSVAIDMSALYANVRPKVDSLSKYVHVREATADLDAHEVDAFVVESLAFLVELLRAIASCRKQVTDALEQQIQDETVMALITEDLDHVDVLSSSHSVEQVDVLTTHIDAIDHEVVRYTITGEVGIDFHWGPSNDGIDGTETFPFILKTSCSVHEMGKFEDSELELDTGNWHQAFEPDPDDLYGP